MGKEIEFTQDYIISSCEMMTIWAQINYTDNLIGHKHSVYRKESHHQKIHILLRCSLK